ncbi:hypothetical protein EYF80_067539 [Liparis tanakae]
MKPPD